MMTRATAAELLRDLGQDDQSDYGQALALAARVLDPPPRKPKTSANMRFLRIKFPYDPSKIPDRLRELDYELSPQARAQFAYGNPKARRDAGNLPDATIAAAARA